MNLESYIKKYGEEPILIKPFNEVDNVILSTLSYIDFSGIVSIDESMLLKDAAKLFFQRYDKSKTIFSTTKAAIEVFSFIKSTERYGNLKLYNYVYKMSNDEQFSALFIDLTNELTYISFEGTDELISGWGEDAALSYKFPVPAQKDAIAYVNKLIPVFSKRKYILGGHSKGGNLALVASMYANIFIRNKIIKIYSNDGPGLRLKEFESRRYKRVEKKYELIIQKYTIVGLLLKYKEDMVIVDTTIKSPYAHCFKYWRVDNDLFKRAELSKFSKKMNEILTSWIATYSYEERKEFIENILEIFKKCNIESLLDIKEAKLKSLIKILKESKQLDKKSKGIILSLLTTSVGMLKNK